MIDVNEYVAPSEASYYIIDDSIPQTWHPVDGKHYQSRSRMAQVGKEHGLIEIGNERVKTKKYATTERERTENRERLAYAYEAATRNRRY